MIHVRDCIDSRSARNGEGQFDLRLGDKNWRTRMEQTEVESHKQVVRLGDTTTAAETVPEGIPFAVPRDELTKQDGRIPEKARGKFNVPRERFHLRGKDEYLWAGLVWR